MNEPFSTGELGLEFHIEMRRGRLISRSGHGVRAFLIF